MTKHCGTVTMFLLTAVLGTSLVRAQEPSNPAAAVHKSAIEVLPDAIKWGECPPALPAGAQCALTEGDMKVQNVLFGYRVKMPDNYRISPHFHPADEHLVAIAGTFNLGHGDKLDPNVSRAFPAGSFMVLPKGMHHFAWTKGETIVHVYAIGPWGLTYVNPKDDPRNR